MLAVKENVGKSQAYNLRRVLNLVGFAELMAAVAT